MVECNVLKFGSFTLKSGRQSPFFMNAGAYITGIQLKTLGRFYAEAIHENFDEEPDVFFGPAYKGIPLAVATAIAYSELYGKEIKYCSDRKELKDHGADKGSLLGYNIKDGDKVIIIEDVTTSGKSIEEVYPKIKAQEETPGKIKIIGEIVSLDRMEKALDSENSAKKQKKKTHHARNQTFSRQILFRIRRKRNFILMTPQKQIIILVAFSLAGLIFIFQGIYFLSKKYQNALKETQNSEKGKKNSENSAKILGYISLAIGFLTIFCGIILKIIPQVFQYLALFYVIFLIVSFSVIIFSFKK